MKAYFSFRSFIYFFLIALLFFGCTKDKQSPFPEEIRNATDLATYGQFYGDHDGDVVIVNAQGGPELTLDDEMMKEIVETAGLDQAQFVNVHQVQTHHPEWFTKKDITFEEAIAHNLTTIDNMKKVIDYYDTQKDKKVYVMGISFGEFVIQELIAQHGTHIAEHFFIAVGRLDFEDSFWKEFSQGNQAYFEFDAAGNAKIVNVDQETSVSERNISRLAAGLGHHRYTRRLSNVQGLSKITYVYGDRDKSIGKLTLEELAFMQQKNMKVIRIPGGSHSAASIAGVKKLKEYFNLP